MGSNAAADSPAELPQNAVSRLNSQSKRFYNIRICRPEIGRGVTVRLITKCLRSGNSIPCFGLPSGLSSTVSPPVVPPNGDTEQQSTGAAVEHSVNPALRWPKINGQFSAGRIPAVLRHVLPPPSVRPAVRRAHPPGPSAPGLSPRRSCRCALRTSMCRLARPARRLRRSAQAGTALDFRPSRPSDRVRAADRSAGGTASENLSETLVEPRRNATAYGSDPGSTSTW